MAKSNRVAVPTGRRNRAPVTERVTVAVRATPEQRAFLHRLGDGSLSIGFDRAVAAAAAREVRS